MNWQVPPNGPTKMWKLPRAYTNKTWPENSLTVYLGNTYTQLIFLSTCSENFRKGIQYYSIIISTLNVCESTCVS